MIMTIDHRKTAITAELLQVNVNSLIEALAKKVEEVEAAQAKIAELEAKLTNGAT